MSGSNLSDQFIEIVVLGKVEKAAKMVDRLLQENHTAHQIIYDGLVKGLEMVGQKMDEGEYFLPDLIVSGEVAKITLAKLKPYFAKKNLSLGTVVAGTVCGDMHDIGLNLVAITLEGSGFRVINLGVNTTKESFIRTIREEKADILAMSALITTTMSYMQEVIIALKENNLREKVKVMVGGAPLNAEYAAAIGADAFGASAREAVLRANEFIASQ